MQFSEITVPVPSAETVAARYAELEDALAAAKSETEALAVVKCWDDYRRELRTWESLVDLRFNQDTRNEQYKRDRDLCDELRPKFTDGQVRIMRKLINGPWRSAIEK